MRRVIQCVPNFSEGRNLGTVEAIADSITSSDDALLIDYSSDVDHNRSVYTILGEPEAIRAAVLKAVSVALERIDLHRHAGQHPRIGAADVIPVVPLRGVSMAECIGLSHMIGDDLALMGVPVYYYEMSATRPNRCNLADVRRGGFERLCESRLEGDSVPDAGPCRVHATGGATAVGARRPLVAYNINLDDDDMDAGREIALHTRERESGLPGVKAMAVWLASRRVSQISMNLTEPDMTPLKRVYDWVSGLAAEHGIGVLESQVVGALSRNALAGATRDELRLAGFRETQILEGWLD